MAKFELKFYDNNTNNVSIEVFKNQCNEIEIQIEYKKSIIDGIKNKTSVILLDKSTAIKFAKTLRTEINKIDTEVNNG